MSSNKTAVAKELQKLQKLLTKGTPKQKALLICNGTVTLGSGDSQQVITDEDSQAIKDSLKDSEEVKEYNKWLGVHQVYIDMSPAFGLAVRGYEAEVHTMRSYLTRWEDYAQQEDHFNIIYQRLLETGDEEAIETFRGTVRSLTFMDAEVEVTDTTVAINIDRLYSLIKMQEEILTDTYAFAKSLVIETEAFQKRTRSEKFTLGAITDGIERLKENPYTYDLERYSRKRLQDDIASGAKVTEMDRKRAVLPYYEELQPKQDVQDYFKREYNKRLGWYAKGK